MKNKHFLSISDLTSDEVVQIVQKAQNMKLEDFGHPLEGKVIALLFEKPSLRTRVSLEVAIRQLGGSCFFIGGSDIGLGIREPVADIVRVLERQVDAIVARVFSHNNLHLMANHSSIPVINALSDLEHPCQALADLLTIQEHKGDLRRLHVAFVGDGNNVAASLVLACGSVGMDFTLSSPQQYQVHSDTWKEAKIRASFYQSNIRWIETPQEAVRNADVVYTDVWTSMGQEEERSKRLKDFYGYQVNNKLMACAKPNAIFMHDLPAHQGEEISEGMLDNIQSVVFDQAENRLHSLKAILAKVLS